MVTITGTGFGSTQGVSAVWFDCAGGTPTSWSDTRIIVPAPCGGISVREVVVVGG